MAGTVKKLQFSEGTDVGAPTDLSLATSTTVISPFVDDAAYVTSEGSAANGSVYLNSTLKQFRYYLGTWRNAVPESDATDATKTFLLDLTGSTTGKSSTLRFASTLNRTYDYPDTSGTVTLLAATQTLTNKTLTSPLLTTATIGGNSLDISAAGVMALFASMGANTLTIAGASSTVAIPGSATVGGSAVVTLSASQTLTNKTLTSPLLTTPTIGGNSLDISSAGVMALFASLGANTLTIAGASSTVAIPGSATVGGSAVVTLAASQTLTNKTLTSPLLNTATIGGNSLDISSAGVMALFASLGANTLTIAGASSTVAIPGSATVGGSAVVTLTATQTLTNKTLTSPALNTATVGGNSLDISAAGTMALFASMGANTLTIAGASSTVAIPGSATVGGSAVVTLSASQTLTNKTLTTPLITAAGSIDVTGSGAFSLAASMGANTLTLGGASSTVAHPGNMTVSGTATVTGALRSNTSLILEDPGAGTFKWTIQSPTLAADKTLTLPTGTGTNGFALTTDGSGVTSWSAVLTNPMTTLGDIIKGGASGVASRLGVGSAYTALLVNSAGTDIAYSLIDNNSIATSAAIAGTKISPAFGSQNISATGTLAITGVPTFTANSGQLVASSGNATWNITAASAGAGSTSIVALGYAGSLQAGYIQHANDTGTMTIGVNGNTASATLTDVSNISKLKMRQASTRSQLDLGGLAILTSDTGSGETYLGTNGNAATSAATANFRLDASGRPYFRTHDTIGSAANAFLDSTTGELYRSTSSLRYKKNIKDLTDADSESVYKLKPITFENISPRPESASNRRYFGFVAEESEKVQPLLVTYADGVADGFQYDRVAVLLVAELKKLRDRIELLEARFA